jgi:hypothetical protein
VSLCLCASVVNLGFLKIVLVTAGKSGNSTALPLNL